jgi:hypothetical protein
MHKGQGANVKACFEFDNDLMKIICQTQHKNESQP